MTIKKKPALQLWRELLNLVVNAVTISILRAKIGYEGDWRDQETKKCNLLGMNQHLQSAALYEAERREKQAMTSTHRQGARVLIKLR